MEKYKTLEDLYKLPDQNEERIVFSFKIVDENDAVIFNVAHHGYHHNNPPVEELVKIFRLRISTPSAGREYFKLNEPRWIVFKFFDLEEEYKISFEEIEVSMLSGGFFYWEFDEVYVDKQVYHGPSPFSVIPDFFIDKRKERNNYSSFNVLLEFRPHKEIFRERKSENNLEFDKIWHRIGCVKLPLSGGQGSMVTFIRRFHDGRDRKVQNWIQPD